MGQVDSRQLRSFGLVLATAGVCATVGLASPVAAPPSQIVFAANRLPRANGEVYRINPDGSRIDLSKSPGLDLFPVVSPDGKRIAFLSVRDGHAAAYVVGTDGRGLRRVSPLLFASAPNNGLSAQFAWTGDSQRLAAEISGSDPGEQGLYIADTRGGWIRVARNIAAGVGAPIWSRDGRLLAYTTNDATIHVVGPTGKHFWNVIGVGTAAWSFHDQLAASANSTTIGVFDKQGHRLATIPGESFAWSPTSNQLAVMNGKRLQLRPNGAAKPVLDVRIARATPVNGLTGISWVGTGRVRIYGGNGWVGYDIAHKRPWVLPAAATAFSSVMSPAGTVAGQQNQSVTPTQAALTLLLPGAQSGRVLASATWCADELPFGALQFIPRTQALIYQSSCSDPSADIYAIDPSGSNLRQLTNTPTDERQPNLSPDGSTVVYVQQPFAEKCQGCPHTLWRVAAGGGTPQQLTSHTDQDATPFDDNPSWSPDSQRIAFLRGGVDGPATLSVMAASGGPVESLGVTGYQPIWGPQQIAYFAPTSKLAVKTIDLATRATHTVSTGGLNENTGPLAWSSAGRLAYLAYDTQGRASIVTVGSSSKPIALGTLLASGALVQGLTWSPDDTHFAFTATNVDGIGDVFTIGADGKNLTQVTHNIGAVGNLSWRRG
jgi:Tol biopolymer transport system component